MSLWPAFCLLWMFINIDKEVYYIFLSIVMQITIRCDIIAYRCTPKFICKLVLTSRISVDNGDHKNNKI